MKKYIFISSFIIFFFVIFNSIIFSQFLVKSKNHTNSKPQFNTKIMKKPESEWKRILSPEEYRILREKGTERAFTGEYDGHFEQGVYLCAGCGSQLFESETKYRSGCGWPAFFNVIPESVEETKDNSFDMERIEITCRNCDGHLGHVFKDGPKPTGLRYCINSVSMDFKKRKNEKK